MMLRRWIHAPSSVVLGAVAELGIAAVVLVVALAGFLRVASTDVRALLADA